MSPKSCIVPDKTVLDQTAALERIDDDWQLYKDLIVLFLEEGPKQIQIISDALSERDFEGAKRQVHSLKSSAASLGADALSSVAETLERSLGEGKTGISQESCKELQNAYKELEPVMRESV